jgi:hypothetical protein
MGIVTLVFIGYRVKWPIHCLQTISHIEPGEVYFDVFVCPDLLEHCVQLFPNVNIII